MPKAVTIRIDETLKKQADETLEEIGLNMTTYFTSSLKALVREKKVPFELSTIPIQPVANPTLEEQLAAAVLRHKSKVVDLDCDENGNILIDKDKHPEIYDWAVNS